MNPKRATILAQVLEHINNDDWDRMEGFLVFGKEAFEPFIGGTGDPEDVLYAYNLELLKLLARSKVSNGNRTVAQKISLQPITEDRIKAEGERWMSNFFSTFPDLVQALAASKPSLAEGKDDAEADALDAALAAAAVRDLDIAFGRISMLDAMGIDRGSVRNAEYFEEAHKCNLAGLNIASAVLCRAMLEAALQQVVDPQRKLNPRSAPGYSPIMAMIDQAEQLGGERKRAAKEIKNAGDAAIHPQRIPDFRKSYAQRMPEIIDNLRKILIDLYSESA